jgi:hypothetical protein
LPGARDRVNLPRMSKEPAYRWVIVLVGALMGCLALGAMFSLPVFLPAFPSP